MTNLSLTQLSTSEFKLDAVDSFCLNSSGNCMALVGSTSDVTVFELMNGCDTMLLMPYSNKQITVKQNKPISAVIKNINLVKIYETATVQESQELALDFIYTADCAVEPLKAKVLQANIIKSNSTDICCVLTSYGYCEIFKKAAITQEWESLNTNLSKILITEIFSSKLLPTDVRNFKDFTNFVNKFIITCFVMSLLSSELVIYLGTAAGYVVAIKYDKTSCKFKKYCHFQTSLNRITYINIYKHFLLVACDQGKVLLLKINFESGEFQELDYLWSKSDRMCCRKAIFSYSDDLKSYFVVFCKAAHVMVYRLDLQGAIISTSTLYVGGITITGIESICANELMITTIMGTIKSIKINCPTEEELYIEELVIKHQFDVSNYQILGLAASPSKNLWSFVLYRNKDYVHQSAYSPTSTFLNVCKLNSQDSFTKLINLNLRNMNMAQDLILAINLDIFNNIDVDKYMEYLNVEKLNFPAEINDAFLQKLQIKIIITRNLATYQNLKYKKMKMQTKNEVEILEPSLQIVYILERIRYFKKLISKDIKLTKFQQVAVVCMQSQYHQLLKKVAEIKNEENEHFHKTVDKFLKFFTCLFENYNLDTTNFIKPAENCMICNSAITNFIKCEQGHDIKRCIISCTQLSLFKTIHCTHCYVLARNDDAVNLQELFATDDAITCIYCRFLLKQDEF